MALFLSRYDNKIDRKGRVSVPAPFRAKLSAQPFGGIVAYPSPTFPAIEACGMDRIEELAANIDDLNPYSDDHAYMTTAILEQAHELAFDPEGRVVLPKPLLEHAGITETATFVGSGATFRIWDPGAYDEYLGEARVQAKERAPRFQWKRREGAT